MPPKPAQAGKFKPLKRPGKPAAKPASAPEAEQRGKSPSREGRGRDGGGIGRGEVTSREGGRSGRGGRDGRGRGRGRFIAPTGAAFFTGASAKQPDQAVPAAPQPEKVTSIAAGQDGAVVLPFTKPFSSDGDRSSSSFGVARTAAESMAAAARARLGEGEEIIVAEMEIDEAERKKVSVLESSSVRRDGMPSLFDDENTDEIMPMGVDSNYVYDSDSSEEERRRVKKGGRETPGMIPLRLPFPLANHQSAMYACQEVVEEKKDGVEGVVSSMMASQLANPDVVSPFLDWNSAETTDDAKFIERNSWFLMKFPTRLPHLDHGSLVGGASKQTPHQSGGVAVKSEVNEDGLEIVGSNTEIGDASASAGGIDIGAGGIGGIDPVGYDNTLKDIAPGRYGKIVVYKSGRTELVVGGKNGEPEVRALRYLLAIFHLNLNSRYSFDPPNIHQVRMLINEGLQCGFRQEAVAIDHEEGTFVPMGDVSKSLVVTPDVERAFVFS